MLCQVEKNEHFRHLIFAFNQGLNAAKATCNICAVYGEDAIAERTTWNWYTKFKNGNLDLEDTPCSGHPGLLVQVNFHPLQSKLGSRMAFQSLVRTSCQTDDTNQFLSPTQNEQNVTFTANIAKTRFADQICEVNISPQKLALPVNKHSATTEEENKLQ